MLVIANITLKYFFQIDVVDVVDVVDVQKKTFRLSPHAPLEITSIFSSEYPGGTCRYNTEDYRYMLGKYRILLIISPKAENNNENSGLFQITGNLKNS